MDTPDAPPEDADALRPKKPIDWVEWGSIVGIFVLIATVSVPVYLYWIQRTDKLLSYGIVSEGPLVSVRDNLNGRLKILLDGKPIGSVNLIVLRVQNTGNVAIRKADYDKPLSIDFGTGSQVLGSEIIYSKPNNLGETLKTTPQEIYLTPILLNKGDGFVIKALVNSPAPNVTLDGRIADVTDFSKVDIAAPQQAPPVWSEYTIAFYAVFVVAIIVFNWRLARAVAAQTREVDRQELLIRGLEAKQKDGQIP